MKSQLPSKTQGPIFHRGYFPKNKFQKRLKTASHWFKNKSGIISNYFARIRCWVFSAQHLWIMHPTTTTISNYDITKLTIINITLVLEILSKGTLITLEKMDALTPRNVSKIYFFDVKNNFQMKNDRLATNRSINI